MKKRKKHMITIIILIFILYLAAGGVLPFYHHKKASAYVKEHFDPKSCYSDKKSSERVMLINDNSEALLWRLRVIESASDEIILSTFDFCDDKSGQDIMSALMNAADRDVKVRIIVDGINGLIHLKGRDNFKALTTHPNIEVKFYNPVNILKPWDINLRMHDKYLIADNSVYILGGRNTCDLFLGDYSNSANIDYDLLVYETDAESSGNSIAQLKNYFEETYALSSNKVIEYHSSKKTDAAKEYLAAHYASLKETCPEAFTQTDFMEDTLPANKITLCTNPNTTENKAPDLWYMMHQLMLGGKDIIIQTPYIICSEDMYRDLKELGNSAENFEIITNAVEKGANPWGCTDYLNQKDNILQTGAEIYEVLRKHSTHTKSIIIDDRISIVGSYNLDMRSTYLDTEMMLVVDCQELNTILRADTDTIKEEGKHVYTDGSFEYGSQYTPVEMSTGKKVFYGILRILIRPVRHLL